MEGVAQGKGDKSRSSSPSCLSDSEPEKSDWEPLSKGRQETTGPFPGSVLVVSLREGGRGQCTGSEDGRSRLMVSFVSLSCPLTSSRARVEVSQREATHLETQ